MDSIIDSFLDKHEIYQYVGEQLKPLLFQSIKLGVQYGVIGFLFGVATILLLKKYKFFQRTIPIWNALVKFYYPVIIIVFIASGTAWGVIKVAENKTVYEVEKTFLPVLESNMPSLKAYLKLVSTQLPEELETVDDALAVILKPLYFEPASEGRKDQQIAKAINYITMNTGKWIVTGLVGAIMIYAGSAGGHVDFILNKESILFTISTIKELDLSKVDQDFFTILKQTLLKQVNKMFKGFYSIVIQYLALFVLFGAFELTVYRHFAKKRQEKEDQEEKRYRLRTT